MRETMTRHAVPLIVALFCGVALLIAAQSGPSSLSARVGIVSLRQQKCYLSIDTTTLQAGAQVTAIDPGMPTERFTLKVLRRVRHDKWPARPLVMLPDDRQPPLYELTCPNPAPEVPFVGLGIVGLKGTTRPTANGIAGDFAGNGKDAFAYRCTSSETVHLIVRSAPAGTLLWRAGYYLGYDVVPTCKPDDYK